MVPTRCYQNRLPRQIGPGARAGVGGVSSSYAGLCRAGKETWKGAIHFNLPDRSAEIPANAAARIVTVPVYLCLSFGAEKIEPFAVVDCQRHPAGDGRSRLVKCNS